MARWGNRATGDLITQARSTMPPDNPGGLPAETYSNIAAFMLQSNGGTPDANRRRPGTTARVGAGLTGQAPAAAVAAAAPPRPEPTGVIVAGTVPSFTPVTDAMLRSPAAEDWLMLRHDYGASSFSPLAEITPDNAKLLQLEWIWPMRDGGTNQPAPVVHDGIALSREHRRHRASARRAHRRPDLGASRRRRGRAARHHALPEPADLPERRRVGRAAAGCAARSRSTRAPAKASGAPRCPTSTPPTADRSP